MLNLCYVLFSETIQVCVHIDREIDFDVDKHHSNGSVTIERLLVNIEKNQKSYSSNDLFSSLSPSLPLRSQSIEASLRWVWGKHYEIMLLGHHHHHAKRQHQKKVSSFVDRFWKESGLQQRNKTDLRVVSQQQTINEYWYSECTLVAVGWGYQSEPTDKSSLVDRALLRGRRPRRTTSLPTLIMRGEKKNTRTFFLSFSLKWCLFIYVIELLNQCGREERRHRLPHDCVNDL